MGQAVPGNFETAAFWNANVQALGNFLLSVPRFVGYQAHSGTPQMILDSTWVAVLLDTEITDTEGGHSTTSNTSRYVCQVAGTYKVEGAYVASANSTAGFRAAKFMVNGSTTVTLSEKSATPVVGFPTTVSLSAEVTLGVGDYIELFAYQNSGTASPGLPVESNTAADYGCHMRLRWISS
jgi:hypothetical protein